MDLQPQLENEHVLIRPLERDDFDALFAVAKDPLIWEQHPCANRFERNIFSEFFEESLLSKGALTIVDKRSNRIIGSSRYKKIENSEFAVEIGWTFISREFWGGTYNGSIKRIMINHALKFVKNVVFFVGVKNIRSQRAVEKIGGILTNRDDLKFSTDPLREDLIYIVK